MHFIFNDDYLYFNHSIFRFLKFYRENFLWKNSGTPFKAFILHHAFLDLMLLPLFLYSACWGKYPIHFNLLNLFNISLNNVCYIQLFFLSQYKYFNFLIQKNELELRWTKLAIPVGRFLFFSSNRLFWCRKN